MRVQIYELQVEIHELRDSIHKLPVQIYRVMSSRVRTLKARVARLKARVRRPKVRVGRFKAQVRWLKTRVVDIQIVNIRVKRENSEFKTWNLTSYKKLYFHCLASAKLKSQAKVLKNLFQNMTLKNLCVTLNYQKFLASVKKYVRTKWMGTNKCYGTFFVHWFCQAH